MDGHRGGRWQPRIASLSHAYVYRTRAGHCRRCTAPSSSVAWLPGNLLLSFLSTQQVEQNDDFRSRLFAEVFVPRRVHVLPCPVSYRCCGSRVFSSKDASGDIKNKEVGIYLCQVVNATDMSQRRRDNTPAEDARRCRARERVASPPSDGGLDHHSAVKDTCAATALGWGAFPGRRHTS